MLRPEIQTLTLLYTIFDRKGLPFHVSSIENGTPFTYPQYAFTQPEKNPAEIFLPKKVHRKISILKNPQIIKFQA